jgi:hypothetical protein
MGRDATVTRAIFAGEPPGGRGFAGEPPGGRGFAGRGFAGRESDQKARVEGVGRSQEQEQGSTHDRHLVSR